MTLAARISTYVDRMSLAARSFACITAHGGAEDPLSRDETVAKFDILTGLRISAASPASVN